MSDETTKKVVGFLDAVDEIPTKAVWLYSRKVEMPTLPPTKNEGYQVSAPNTIAQEEQDHYLIAIANGYAQCIHYYEVDWEDFKDLSKNGFFKKSLAERIKSFNTKHKLQTA